MTMTIRSVAAALAAFATISVIVIRPKSGNPSVAAVPAPVI